ARGEHEYIRRLFARGDEGRLQGPSNEDCQVVQGDVGSVRQLCQPLDERRYAQTDAQRSLNGSGSTPRHLGRTCTDVSQREALTLQAGELRGCPQKRKTGSLFAADDLGAQPSIGRYALQQVRAIGGFAYGVGGKGHDPAATRLRRGSTQKLPHRLQSALVTERSDGAILSDVARDVVEGRILVECRQGVSSAFRDQKLKAVRPQVEDRE